MEYLNKKFNIFVQTYFIMFDRMLPRNMRDDTSVKLLDEWDLMSSSTSFGASAE